MNRLNAEKSLYLKQHQDNPVHWWPFGPEAIQAAQDQNKPIFLSIGYSSCHWCHVMAHESFSDSETANFMNENFINIKVDREEFPDVDAYYQQACQYFIKRGGWPLSGFLTPALKPYFVGTYYPKERRGQGPTFKELLTELSNAYKNDFSKVEENAQKVSDKIQQGFSGNEKVPFQGHFPAPNAIINALKDYADKENGGFGEAPKFPQFAFYEWAIEQTLEGMIPREEAQHIFKSIDGMLCGGIYDQAKGGIHRYSTDSEWLVPHFEKMLYDQAGLLKLLAKYSILNPSPLVLDAIMQTLEYLNSEMQNEEGIFFSSQDADSEGVEGLYFTFTEDEFEDAINQYDDENETLNKNLDQLKKYFGVTSEGNFESKLNVLHLETNLLAEMQNEENWKLIRRAKRAIIKARQQRIPPATDNKNIASWNFLTATALAEVIQYCPVPAIKKRASDILIPAIEAQIKTFVIAKNQHKMHLQHVNTLGDTLLYAEDYIFFAESQWRTYQVTGNPVFKNNFLETMNFILIEFLDKNSIKTRARSQDDAVLYPNLAVSSFDASFRSPASTFILLARQGACIFPELELMDKIKDLEETLTHQILKNPLGAGEALRALTYPKEIYRVIKVPKVWTQQKEFVRMQSYFMSRFVFDYIEDASDEFQICNSRECELVGKGLEEFFKVVLPQKKAE